MGKKHRQSEEDEDTQETQEEGTEEASEEEDTPPEPSKKKGPRMVTIEIDQGVTVVRRLVPGDTDDDDIPEGSEILSSEETGVMLRRATKPEVIKRGHQVRLKPAPGEAVDNSTTGTVEAFLKSGKLRVKWDNGTTSRHEAKELMRIY